GAWQAAREEDRARADGRRTGDDARRLHERADQPLQEARRAGLRRPRWRARGQGDKERRRQRRISLKSPSPPFLLSSLSSRFLALAVLLGVVGFVVLEASAMRLYPG